jgi:hypothetical protein
MVKITATMLCRLPVIVGLLLNLSATEPNPVDYNAIGRLIQEFKKDERGPYQAIRWFCPDGTILLPKERCPQPGGIQHALAKDIIQKIAREHHLYLGQILAGTVFDSFFDGDTQNSRMMQYQMEKFLQSVDNGWILRRAKYYRGAIQVEDEEYWGENFIKWLTAQDEMIITQYMFLRHIVRDIPHLVETDKWQAIRGLVLTIADSLPAFMNLRIKIHGQPDENDLSEVEAFYQKYKNTMSAAIEKMVQDLIKDMGFVYQSTDIASLQKYVPILPASHPVTDRLKHIIDTHLSDIKISDMEPSVINVQISNLIWQIRTEIINSKKAAARMLLLDLSLDLERILFRRIGTWHPLTFRELMHKNYVLAQSAAGCGYLEIWEWEFIEPLINPDSYEQKINIGQFGTISDNARRVVEWSVAMIRAKYEPAISLFGQFEPLAYGFVDDRIRSSILLPLGAVAGEIEEMYRQYAGRNNEIVAGDKQIQMRGINPGYTVGDLEVITGNPEHITFSPQKIYFLLQAPASMKPVAGIATVSEGNLVSHIQLLARNLAIPNAVISEQSIYEMLPYSGVRVFYAVTPGGMVILKPVSKMTAEEKTLIEQKKRNEERIHVPTTKIDLITTTLLI